jgi:uncharacterized membrane protein
LKEFALELFENYGNAMLYIHIIAAVLFVGMLFAVWLSYRPISEISDEDERYGLFLRVLKQFYHLAFVALVTILCMAVILDVGLFTDYGDPAKDALVHIKEAAWLLITANIIYSFFKYRQARKAYELRQMIEVQEHVIIIIKYIMPFVFVVSLIALLMGSIVRGV